MRINVSVMLAEGEPPMSADDVATQVLEILGGDPAKDHCTASVLTTPSTVAVGVMPPPPNE